MITFRFAGTHGTMVETEPLTSGMVKKKVKLEFSNDWDNRTKMVVFTAGSVSRDVVCVSDVVEIPAEVLAKPLQKLYVGAYGVSDDGEVTPTIRVMGPMIAPGVDPSGDQSTTQSLPVWAQIQTMIGDLKNLDTEVKENLVAAINEAAKTDGSGSDYSQNVKTVNGVAPDENGNVNTSAPTDEQVKASVNVWLEAHPEATTTVQDGAITEEKLSEDVLNMIEAGGGSVYYVATDYGISTDVEDNTPALQTLVDNVSASGGGIIFFPVGTYNFKKRNTRYAVSIKSNVSIVGENIETTVLKQTEAAPYSLFFRMGSPDNPLTGCTFSNFTVDAYETGNTNAVYGKAFFVQYIRDCVFRDLRLRGTIATALGIDFLDMVTIDNVSCVDCGRTYTGSQQGTSGIGIGTGGWDNENFTVTNCICVGSGQYGIFIENQHNVFGDTGVEYSKGCIIANCVVRNGLNKGIGIRGGENVTVIGCETYENESHGIYVDNKCKNVRIMACSSTANGGSGIYLSPDADSSRITIKDCVFVDNSAEGLTVKNASKKLCITNNHTDGNMTGLSVAAVTLTDCVLYGNTALDGAAVRATFSGIATYNDYILDPEEIMASDVSVVAGKTASVQYAVLPTGSNPNVTFTSSNVGVAVVSDSGVVTGISSGTCQITVASKVKPSVHTTVECTVVGSEEEIEITIPNNEFTAGTKLNASGVETSASGAGVTDYVAVTGEAWNITITDLVHNKGAAICLYDSNKTMVHRLEIFDSAAGIEDYSKVLCFVGVAYVRISLNSLGTSTAVITNKGAIATVSNTNFTTGKAIGTDGLPTTSGTAMVTDFLEPLGLYGYSSVSLTIPPKVRSGATLVRIGWYDANKQPLTTPVTDVSNTIPGCIDAAVPSGARYIKLCLGGVKTFTDFEFTMSLYGTEIN